MSSYILHAYPIWDTLNTLGQDSSNVEAQKQLTHWLTFWMMSFAITNAPIPDMFQWIMVTSLYFPFTTEKVRTVLLQYMPYVEQKAGESLQNLKKAVAEKLSNMNNEKTGVSSVKDSGMISKVSSFIMSYVN